MKPNVKLPRVMWHHGTCDACQERNVFVIHFGYDTSPNRDYRMCKDCLEPYITDIYDWFNLESSAPR